MRNPFNGGLVTMPISLRRLSRPRNFQLNSALCSSSYQNDLLTCSLVVFHFDTRLRLTLFEGTVLIVVKRKMVSASSHRCQVEPPSKLVIGTPKSIFGGEIESKRQRNQLHEQDARNHNSSC